MCFRDVLQKKSRLDLKTYDYECNSLAVKIKSYFNQKILMKMKKFKILGQNFNGMFCLIS